MKTLKQFADQFNKHKDRPRELKECLGEQTVAWAEVVDMLLPIRRKRMDFFIENKKIYAEKPLSDKTVEAMWLAKGDGVLEERLEAYKKCLTTIMSNTKAAMRDNEIQARNLH